MLGDKDSIKKLMSFAQSTEFGFEKETFPQQTPSLSWSDLKGKGVIRYNKEEDDEGYTTYTKSFIATDGSFKKHEEYRLPTKTYNRYKAMVNTYEILEEIKTLEEEMKDYADSMLFEISAVIKNQIDFLRSEYDIKEK